MGLAESHTPTTSSNLFKSASDDFRKGLIIIGFFFSIYLQEVEGVQKWNLNSSEWFRDLIGILLLSAGN